MRKALGRLLRSAGLSTDTYGSGEEFLAALPDDPPDCLLLDVQLPGMNGLEVQCRLRQSGLKLPVVFITGSSGLEAREQAMQSGAQEWLRKPVDDLALLGAIARALLGKNVHPAQ